MMGTKLRVQMKWNRLNFNFGLFVLKACYFYMFFCKVPIVKITINLHYIDKIDGNAEYSVNT